MIDDGWMDRSVNLKKKASQITVHPRNLLSHGKYLEDLTIFYVVHFPKTEGRPQL